MIKEESPIGTIIGTVKDTLLLINNNSSELIDRLQFKVNSMTNLDAQSFLLNSQTGLFVVLSYLNPSKTVCS